MPVLIQTVRKPQTLRKLNSVMLSEPKEKQAIKKFFAACAGSTPPPDDNKNIFNKILTPEQLKKIENAIGNTNKINAAQMYEKSIKNLAKY